MKAVLFFFVMLTIALCSQNIEPKFGLTHIEAIFYYMVTTDPEETQKLEDGSEKYWYRESTEYPHRRVGFVINNDELVGTDFIERHDVKFDEFWSIVDKKIKFWKKKYGKPVYATWGTFPYPVEIPDKSFTKEKVRSHLDQNEFVNIKFASKNVHISSVLSKNREYGGYTVRDESYAREYWDKIKK